MTLIVKNAIIESTEITNDYHGCLSAWLYLDYGDAGHQGFGGYALYLPKGFAHHAIQSGAGHFIYRCMQIGEVDKWDKLKGKSIRVRAPNDFGGTILSIGHITKNDWFTPQDELTVKP